LDTGITNLEPTQSASFEAAELIARFPPRWRHANKVALWEIARAGAPFEGTLRYARWPASDWPSEAPRPGAFEVRDGVFEYGPAPDGDTVVWHMNFADPLLFGYYSGPLMAQDELQVAEHPALGSLRDALAEAGQEARTEDRHGPTPVTVTGVQRRVALETAPNAAAGRPRGLYGNAFASANLAQVRSGAVALTPPTLSNILALAAPSGGYGPYTDQDLQGTLRTAYSGFAAAAREGGRLLGRPVRTVIHTGFWGCGAFGGNRTVMTILQALAADLAGVDLVFHGVDAKGAATAASAHASYVNLRLRLNAVSRILGRVRAQGHEWGESDGN